MSFAMDWSVSLSVFARVSAGPFRASVGACWDASRPPRPLTACAAPTCRIFLCLVFSYGCMLVVDHSLLTRTRVPQSNQAYREILFTTINLYIPVINIDSTLFALLVRQYIWLLVACDTLLAR